MCENGREVFFDVDVQHGREVLVPLGLHHTEYGHLGGQRSVVIILSSGCNFKGQGLVSKVRQ